MSTRPRSFEFRLRLGLTKMLVPLAVAMILLLGGLLRVINDQHQVRSDITDELATVSALREDIDELTYLVVAFEVTPSRGLIDEFRGYAASIDANLARARTFDEAEERAHATDASEAWEAVLRSSDRMFDGGATARSGRVEALRQLSRVTAELDLLDRASLAEIEARLERSATTSAWIVGLAVTIGVLAAGANMLMIRRLLATTFRPLRRLAEDVAEFTMDDLEHRIAVDGDREFQEVGDAFNSMADRLQHTLGSLEHQAFHDALTGLPNRASLIRHLQQPGSASRAVILFDLDGFKAINDGLGHAAGDEALIQIGRRIQGALGADDLVARLGGDEFAVVLSHRTSDESVEAVAAVIGRSVSQPLEIAGRGIVLHASGGIAHTISGEDPIEVIRRADVALYVAKEHGSGSVHRFLPEMLREVERQLELETDLRVALARGEIEVHYQPTVGILSGAVTGVEALARWRHPEHGLIPPVSFIPVAEATGEIMALGRFVLDTACRQAKAWQQLPGLAELSMSVNVSAVQLHSAEICDHVAAALRHSGLAAASLTLEVTETVMADPEAVSRVHDLKDLGVRVALDDFGTGYSSLSYLQHLPIDILKIDKSFIDGLGQRADRDVLASAIVRLGRSLGLETVAEGVEKSDQLRLLTSVGCEVVQGYLFARPAAAADIEQRLLELVATTSERPDLPADAATGIRVEVGPLEAEAAREWIRHAHWALDELDAGRILPQRIPTAVLAMMRDYLRRWTVSAAVGDTFLWTADEDPQVLALLMRYWLPVSEALAEQTRLGTHLISDDAGAFSEAMVHGLLVALASHDSVDDVEAALLARAWPSHDRMPVEVVHG